MKRLFVYLVLFVQLAGLVALYAYHASDFGAHFLLRTRPVDPRDFLRGDYVILNYEISGLPKEYEGRWKSGQELQVRLRPDGEFWVIDRVSERRERDGAPWLRATLDGGRLKYGIESYYVAEGRGNPPGSITVEIGIRGEGNAQLRQLFSDGAPWR